jgi:hypothetical protein
VTADVGFVLVLIALRMIRYWAEFALGKYARWALPEEFNFKEESQAAGAEPWYLLSFVLTPWSRPAKPATHVGKRDVGLEVRVRFSQSIRPEA